VRELSHEKLLDRRKYCEDTWKSEAGVEEPWISQRIRRKMATALQLISEGKNREAQCAWRDVLDLSAEMKWHFSQISMCIV